MKATNDFDRPCYLSRVVENIPSSIVIVDRNLQVVAANQAFLRTTQRDLGAILGRRLADVIPHDLLDRVQATEITRQVFSTGKALESGKAVHRAPGVPAQVYLMRFVPVAPEIDPEVQYVMLLMDDITQLERLGAEARQAERDLVTMKASEQDLMIWLNREGRIVSWNPAAEQATGLVLAEVRGRAWAELCARDDRAACKAALRDVVSGSFVRGLEMVLLAAGGQNMAVSWSISPIGDDEGKIAGIVAVGRDLTERHQMERLLIQSDKLASLGVMASSIAHELRNPLTVIAASTRVAQGAFDDSRLLRECLQKIEAGVKRASLVIDSLLELARPQGDKAAVLDVGNLLETALSFTSDQLAMRRVRPRVEVEDHNVKVLGSAVLLQQVFINLILNACAAMPTGGDLVASAKSDYDGSIRIAFRDSGEGISAENLPKLFDPFFTTNRSGHGSAGLGLSVTLSIVKQFGGSIEVESELGQGSTFTVVLPYA